MDKAYTEFTVAIGCLQIKPFCLQISATKLERRKALLERYYFDICSPQVDLCILWLANAVSKPSETPDSLRCCQAMQSIGVEWKTQ